MPDDLIGLAQVVIHPGPHFLDRLRLSRRHDGEGEGQQCDGHRVAEHNSEYTAGWNAYREGGVTARGSID